MHQLMILRFRSRYSFKCLQRLFSSQPTSFRTSRIHPSFQRLINGLQKESAKQLVPKLIFSNELGYISSKGTEAKAGTLVHYVIEQKKLHPDKVLLVRCGDFYEAYGVDAITLVEYAGLNPMGGYPRAGCPIANLQQTLDHLTDAGLCVAVYEETHPATSPLNVSKSKGSNQKGIKDRYLSQIISPSQRNYAYGMNLRATDIEFAPCRPIVGILKTPHGYTATKIMIDERRMVTRSRLTLEGLSVILSAESPALPLYVHNVNAQELATAYRYLENTGNEGGIQTEEVVCTHELHFPDLVLQRCAEKLELSAEDCRRFHTTSESTTAVSAGTVLAMSLRPRPVYTTTALQIGLIANAFVPSLLPHITDQVCRQQGTLRNPSVEFLRRWIMNPPTWFQAQCMHVMNALLSDDRLPSSWSSSFRLAQGRKPMRLGKVTTLLSTRQANVALFHQLYEQSDAMRGWLQQIGRCADDQWTETVRWMEGDDQGLPALKALVRDRPSLAPVVFAGMLCQVTHGELSEGRCVPWTQFLAWSNGLHSRVTRIHNRLATSITLPSETSADDCCRDASGRIPDEFFSQNEELFRGRVSQTVPAMQRANAQVKKAAEELCLVVATDFEGANEIVFDTVNNMLCVRKPAAKGKALTTPEHWEPAVDRKGGTLPQRLTTAAVKAATTQYLDAVQEAVETVVELYQELCSDLYADLNTIQFVATAHTVLEAVNSHVRSSLRQQWTLPASLSPLQSSPSLCLPGLFPYWLDRNTAVLNDVAMHDELFLLTAPNMSGKSTIMRSVLSAALLANCGLFVPCARGSSLPIRVPLFTSYFLRTSSYDMPAANQSAFATEMDDMRVLFEETSPRGDMPHRTLAMVDEIGKGTSTRDGTAIAGAILEALSEAPRRVLGMFATHLHELLDLPLRLNHGDDSHPRVSYKTMRVEWRHHPLDPATLTPHWTFQLCDGVAVDSMALHTALAFRIPATVVDRALALRALLENDAEPASASVPMLHALLPVCPTALAAQLRDVAQRFRLNHNLCLETDQDVVVLVDGAQQPPAALEGVHCVYLVLYQKRGVAHVYVGETAALDRRLTAHRQALDREGCVLQSVLVMPVRARVGNAQGPLVSHRSLSRGLERAMIMQLRKAGYSVSNRPSDEQRLAA